MLGETLNADHESALGTPRLLPTSLLYSIFARIGGHGLDTDSFEALRASYRGKFLGKAIAYDNRQKEIPKKFIQSLRWRPVRLLSFLEGPYYYGAKKKYLGRVAARHLETGRYDFFHSWSGDCLEALRVAKKKKIPSLIEIPTWHRQSQMSELKSQKDRHRGSRASRWSRKDFSRSTISRRWSLFFPKKPPNHFARQIFQTKRFFICRGESMSIVSSRRSIRQFSAPFFRAL